MPAALPTPLVDRLDRRRFLLGLAAAGLLSACGTDSPSTGSATPDCRAFDGDEGEVCLPPDSGRIVAVNYFSYEILQSLGIAAVAVTGVDDLPPYLGGGTVDLPDIGTFQEPDLEAIVALEPDLIVGNPDLETTDELARLAPFVAIDTQVPEPWQRATRRHAEALGVPEKASAMVAEYDARVTALAARIGDPGAMEVSLVSILPGDGVGVIGDGRAAGALLRDVGFARPAAQRGVENFLFPSPEEYAMLDGDLLLVNAYGDDAEVADLRAELESSPLYPTLEAVRTGQVADVGTHWFFHGPIAARLMLGDLERRFA
jgi:iron complex transport system substrate-binding protein